MTHWWARSAAVAFAAAVLGTLTPQAASAGIQPPRFLPRSVDPASPSEGGPKLPATGALFGSSTSLGPEAGPSQWVGTLDFEEMIGREKTLTREFYNWDEVFPSAYEYWARDQGITLFVSWSSAKGGGDIVDWADIASGQHDALIDDRAESLIAFGAPLFFTFHHEPGVNWNAGSPEEFVDAWQHVHDRFEAKGVTNVSYVLTLTAWAYSEGEAEKWYPGDAYVDLLAADGYNRYGCEGRNDPWTSFEDVFSAFYDYGVDKGKPMLVAEFASGEDPAVLGRKAEWITDAAQTLKSWPQIKGVSWYHNDSDPSCIYFVDTSESALDAYVEMGSDPYFNPPVESPPVTPVTAYVASFDFAYSITNGYATMGKEVEWLFDGPSSHSVTDSSGMGLFESGTKAAGSTYKFAFLGAGNYSYKCKNHATMTNSVKIPMTVAPLAGGVSTQFTLVWAAGRPPSGYVYDVKIQRPGSPGWSYLVKDSTGTTMNFIPDAGKGSYAFHARMKKSSTGKASKYSITVSILVS
jgi:plastocyanin